MKVLFAVHDEKVSSSIVKKYQREFKEIISYKNVYYFNAIIKELQRDKTYDRIVIDEELEEFTSSSYEQKDKFIFDKLDNITDEASNSKGNDIPIILITSDRRTKSEEFLVKIFGIGIYNAIIGNDKSTDEVCRLINKPRAKKQAKVYYRIDSEDVNYKKENEDDVSEEEMQYILSYFNKLGNNEDKYVECFKNIVSQYNENQMKIIISILPLHVKSILEENSIEYQKIVAKSGRVSSTGNSVRTIKAPGTSEKLLTLNENKSQKPIVVPSKMDNTLIKKVSIKKPVIKPTQLDDEEDIDEDLLDVEIKEEIPETTPKRRGRPRKNPLPEDQNLEPKTPKKRGRPRKNAIPEEIEKELILPGFDDADEEEFLPGIDDLDDINTNEIEEIVPNEVTEVKKEEQNIEQITDVQDEMVLPGIDNNEMYNLENNNYDYSEYNNLLSSTKKVMVFVGTSKNGTSFIINNIAKILSDSGIDTAILDTTKNKNAYYIYTKNEEELRQQAAQSIDNLIYGRINGVKVENNLTVYTELPNQDSNLSNVGPILENLVKAHSAVLIDCDFETPMQYFENAQEIYLVQSMDVLTIQPLTAFLRELKAKNILEQNKLKIILNKSVKIRGITPKTIVGGMAFYNDPEMSFMTELFDRNLIVPFEVPFMTEVYNKYLEELIQCEISVDKYPKEFQNILKNLAANIYPLLPAKTNKEKAKKGYQYSNDYNNGFSNSVNNTLNNMRNRY